MMGLTRTRGLALALLLTAVALAATTAGAAAAGGTVVAVVRPGGTPVADAKIVLSSSADSAYEATQRTDATGRATFDGVPAGQVTLKCYADDDRLLASGEGDLADGGNLTVELHPGP